MAWEFDWRVRTDHHGKPAGIFDETPFPITEASTSYTVMNDENPDGKEFQLGTKYYVDGNAGDDANAGTDFNSPKETIKNAVNVVRGLSPVNATIIVRGAYGAFDGVYEEEDIDLPWGTGDTARAMIVGYGQERPIVDGSNPVSNTGGIFESCGATGRGWVTVQRLELRNHPSHGVIVGNTSESNTDTHHCNCIDLKCHDINPVGWDASSGPIYYRGAPDGWVFHCTSYHGYAHTFKMGDGAYDSLLEWCVAYEAGYWDGIETPSAPDEEIGHPTAFDFPDHGENITLRYSIGYTSQFFAVQFRGWSTGVNPIGDVLMHHCEIYDSTHFEDIDWERDHHQAAQVIMHNAQSGRGNATFECHDNIIRNSSDSDARGLRVYTEMDSCKIYNNLFYGNQAHDIEITVDSTTTEILNNTFYGTHDSSFLLTLSTGSNTEIRNNIFFNNGSADCVNLGSATHTHNLYYNPGAGGEGVTSETGWIQPTSQDFLREVPTTDWAYDEGYPEKPNAGTDMSAVFTSDFHGRARSNWDVGCCEFYLDRATAIKVEGMDEPTGVIDPSPEFSATVTPGPTAITKMFVQVSSSTAFDGDLMWDSTALTLVTPVATAGTIEDISYGQTA